MIVKSGKGYVVKDSTGTKVLGTHPDRKSALRQFQAIEISKAAARAKKPR